MVAILGMAAIFYIGLLAVTVLFLLAQSKFVKSMNTSNEFYNTSVVWIWTQLIPIWNFVAIPVTLSKINKQYQFYVEENKIQSNSNIKPYDSLWGWIWFGGSVGSIFVPLLAIVSLVGIIGFWVHISNVKSSLVLNTNN